jgi:hypothetical protein
MRNRKYNRGKFFYVNGEIYSYKEYYKKDGYGKYINKKNIDVTIYEGLLIDDKKSGYGKYIYSDATMYEGSWSDDKKNGHGT